MFLAMGFIENEPPCAGSLFSVASMMKNRDSNRYQEDNDCHYRSKQPSFHRSNLSRNRFSFTIYPTIQQKHHNNQGRS